MEILDSCLLPIPVLEKPCYVVSDLHLGTRNPADNFEQNESRFLRFLDRVYQEDADMYLAGDVYDIWENNNVDAIYNSYTKLITMLNKFPKINGNHDYGYWNKDQIILNNTILIQHGHQGDIWNSDMSFIGKLLTKLNYYFECLTKGKSLSFRSYIYSFVSRLPSNMSIHRLAEWEVNFMEYAYSELKRTRACAFIFGHTHNPRILQKSPKVIANCGDWVYNCTALKLSPFNNKTLIELMDFSKDY